MGTTYPIELAEALHEVTALSSSIDSAYPTVAITDTSAKSAVLTYSIKHLGAGGNIAGGLVQSGSLDRSGSKFVGTGSGAIADNGPTFTDSVFEEVYIQPLVGPQLRVNWYIIEAAKAQDLANRLSEKGIPEHKVKGFAYDATNKLFIALYHK